MPRSLSPQHQQKADTIHQTFRSRVQDLNRKYAGKLSADDMARIQSQFPTNSNIAPGAGLYSPSLTQRTLSS